MKIEMGKKYKAVYVSGDVFPATVLTTTRRVSAFDNNNAIVMVHTTDRDVAYYTDSQGCTTSFKLEEVTPWDDLKIDDLVLVSDYKSEGEYIRHFAGFDRNGEPHAFLDGDNSKTTRENKNNWKYIVPYKKP